MSGKCPDCGGKTAPLFTGVYCVAGCDLPRQADEVTQPDGTDCWWGNSEYAFDTKDNAEYLLGSGVMRLKKVPGGKLYPEVYKDRTFQYRSARAMGIKRFLPIDRKSIPPVVSDPDDVPF